MPGLRVPAVLPMRDRSGPSWPPSPSMTWHRPQSSLRYSWRPRASGSVAAGSSHASTVAIATQSANASRIITRDATGGRVDAALERWGLRADADRPVEHLSAGQRRRAALSRLEVETCAVALLDEPFAELDADGVALLRTVLLGMAPLGTAVLIA